MCSTSLDSFGRVCCIIPTLNAGPGFSDLIDTIKSQAVNSDLYIVDSGSNDNTIFLALSEADDVIMIDRCDFNHGATRQMMMERFHGYDYYIYLSQDVLLESEHAFEFLLTPFRNKSVGCAYGRQLPHIGASAMAQHARLFNYRDVSSVRSFNDVSVLGIKTAFMSNCFAAYRSMALKDIGGFPSNVILSEDMYVAAKMLLKGWTVAYAANAVCRHSHDYTPCQEFSRYFDIGVFHARESWIREELGNPEGEGFRFVLSELCYIGINRAYLWPLSIFRNAAKLIGFRLGLWERYLPRALKKRFSMHKSFW